MTGFIWGLIIGYSISCLVFLFWIGRSYQLHNNEDLDLDKDDELKDITIRIIDTNASPEEIYKVLESEEDDKTESCNNEDSK